ncbi:MAG: single-stranded DNA-binding protein [Anaerolineae bacterium]
MPRGLNKVMIIGQLGRDPEMRYTPSGKAVTSFSVAVSQSRVSSEGEPQDTVEWFHVVAWGDLAERCKRNLGQGSTVYVEGHLQTRAWPGEDLQPRHRTELVAEEVIFLDE